MADQDDLPVEGDAIDPAGGAGGFAEQLGGTFAGAVMMAAIFAIVGAIAYFILTWTR